jgi:N-formylmaleamate deformylase
MKRRILPLAATAFLLVVAGTGTSAAQTVQKPAPFAVQVTGTGKPMILIPGLNSGGYVWDGTVAHFKDRYQCHVLTLAGFAGQPPLPDGEPFLEQVRDGILRYIRDNKLQRPVLVGHSLGAFMAFWVASTAPDEVGPLVAVDGLPYLPAVMMAGVPPETVRQRAAAMRDSLKVQTPEQLGATLRFTLSTMITDPKEVEKAVAVSAQSDPATVGRAFYELMATDLREPVRAIKTPVLLLGALAMSPTPEFKKMAEEVYRAQVAPIPRHKVAFPPTAKHFIQLDDPEFLFREMDAFLKEAEGGAARKPPAVPARPGSS